MDECSKFIKFYLQSDRSSKSRSRSIDFKRDVASDVTATGFASTDDNDGTYSFVFFFSLKIIRRSITETEVTSPRGSICAVNGNIRSCCFSFFPSIYIQSVPCDLYKLIVMRRDG